MAAPIPPMLKYSIVYNLLSFPPILIKFVTKFIVCKVLYFETQYLLRLRSPLMAIPSKGMDAKAFKFNSAAKYRPGGVYKEKKDLELPNLDVVVDSDGNSSQAMFLDVFGGYQNPPLTGDVAMANEAWRPKPTEPGRLVLIGRMRGVIPRPLAIRGQARSKRVSLPRLLSDEGHPGGDEGCPPRRRRRTLTMPELTKGSALSSPCKRQRTGAKCLITGARGLAAG